MWQKFTSQFYISLTILNYLFCKAIRHWEIYISSYSVFSMMYYLEIKFYIKNSFFFCHFFISSICHQFIRHLWKAKISFNLFQHQFFWFPFSNIFLIVRYSFKSLFLKRLGKSEIYWVRLSWYSDKGRWYKG